MSSSPVTRHLKATGRRKRGWERFFSFNEKTDLQFFRRNEDATVRGATPGHSDAGTRPWSLSLALPSSFTR